MSLVARFIGADEVIEQYKKVALPNFSMWCKSAIICQYNGDDLQEGEQMIREEIERNVKRKMGHECFLRIHAQQANTYTLKSDAHYIICFKSYDNIDFGVVNSPVAFNYALMEKLNAIESRMNGYEEQTDDDDDDDQDQDDDDSNEKLAGMISGINKVLDHPLIALLTEKIMNKPNNQAAAINGVEDTGNDQEQLNKALVLLFEKGVTVAHIVKLSKMPAAQLTGLLSLLK